MLSDFSTSQTPWSRASLAMDVPGMCYHCPVLLPAAGLSLFLPPSPTQLSPHLGPSTCHQAARCLGTALQPGELSPSTTAPQHGTDSPYPALTYSM